MSLDEADHLDAATLQQSCLPRYPRKFIAGLSMVDYSVSADGRYIYYYPTTQGVEYGLMATLYPNDQASQTLMMQIFNTFRPVYTTSACT